MARPDDTLEKLTAASPRGLLEELARIGAALAKLERARPEVEVFLASGQALRGRIVRVEEERGGHIALLHTAGPPRNPSVAYVRVDQIAALTVSDANVLVHAPTADAPVPSRLELSRQLVARNDALAGALGRPLLITLATDANDDARRALGLALPLVTDVLTAVAGDVMGKEALAPVMAIELGGATGLEVYFEDGKQKLVLRVPTVLTQPLSHARLRATIEALL